MDLGIIQSGINIVESFELDKTCCESLRNNFSHKINEVDITKITVLDQIKTDVMIGTFPCTRYSSIADISGTRVGDDLFLHFFRHIALEEPEVFVVENVPGMKKFPVVMEALTKIPGYYVRIECPVNANMWLPQERKRLMLFGSKRPMKVEYPQKCSRPQLKDILENDPQINIPNYVKRRLEGHYRDKPIISNANRGDIAPTCVAHYSKDISTRLVEIDGVVRPYTTKEYARLQGFPDDFFLSGSNSDKYRQIGNAVPPPMGYWVGEQIKRYFNRKE